ncbi:TetR/AcrR family transcriptional regulator [Roseovarius sp. CAU 1744]|uniref:TetR/AcrR family transcriptional regulator n=1 Tax=Roseovarius sp. CAU 1744 TaxID=3140368 RepID=UPI00325C3375
MRVDRETARKNREAVVDAAARLFREQGFDGIGIAPLMKQAGLTNGAFYKQFESKEALGLEATERALEQNQTAWRETLETAQGDAISAFCKWYLAQDHIAHRGVGCAFSTLASEAPRRGKKAEAIFADAIEQSLDLLGGYAPMDRAKALNLISGLVGTLILARAVGDSDLRTEIVAAMTEGTSGLSR